MLAYFICSLTAPSVQRLIESENGLWDPPRRLHQQAQQFFADLSVATQPRLLKGVLP